MMEGWGWMSGFGWIFMILFWALLILGAAALARWVFPSGDSAGSRDRRPLEIRKERHARGEITGDQYAQLRRDVES